MPSSQGNDIRGEDPGVGIDDRSQFCAKRRPNRIDVGYRLPVGTIFDEVVLMVIHTISSCGDHLDAVYDAHGICYGCKLRGEIYGFQRCGDCPWLACPMRGGKKEVA